jgi:hypothetical protein
MRAASMVIYGVRDLALPEQMEGLGYVAGATRLLQRAGLPHLFDERSDRTRTTWPHVFDVVHHQESRWHATDRQLAAARARLRWPHPPFGLEVLRFISAEDATALGRLPGGSRPEVTCGLAVFLVEATAKELPGVQSRARQPVHRAIGEALEGVGTVGFDRLTAGQPDQMHASEVPFVLTAAVADDQPDLSVVTGRSLAGCEVMDVVGWRVAVWQDLIAMVAAEDGNSGYWPLQRVPEVALAGVGDAVLMRVLQRYALHMLATRVGAAAPGTALQLQAVAHVIRSRLWWFGLSGDPIVSEVADALARRWDLPDLATETFTGLEVLARRDALDASQRQAKEAEKEAAEAALLAKQAQRLNVLLFYFAAISIALAILSFILDLTSDTIDSTTRVLLLVALAIVLSSAAVTAKRHSARLRRRRLHHRR